MSRSAVLVLVAVGLVACGTEVGGPDDEPATEGTGSAVGESAAPAAGGAAPMIVEGDELAGMAGSAAPAPVDGEAGSSDPAPQAGTGAELAGEGGSSGSAGSMAVAGSGGSAGSSSLGGSGGSSGSVGSAGSAGSAGAAGSAGSMAASPTCTCNTLVSGQTAIIAPSDWCDALPGVEPPATSPYSSSKLTGCRTQLEAQAQGVDAVRTFCCGGA